jgi:hypothetical protein
VGQTINLYNLTMLAMTANVYVDTPSYYEPHIRILKKDVKFLLSTGELLTIRAGFEWDEVSVPYLLQWAFPKSGKYAYSAMVHDALYYASYKSQKFADDEFKKYMNATGGINKKQTWLRWAFVRIFGGIYWNKNKRKPSKRCLKNQQLITIVCQ